MKRNNLTTALLAGLAGAAGLATTAQAVNLNPDGLGQVLVYPYYTVNKGNDTLISVVNTTNAVKAVKVRFVEGRNSREVLDFNLYLSPFDVWTAAVFSIGATGPGNLLTRDTSCTVPAIRTSTTLPTTAGGDRYVPFRNFAYTGTFRDYPTAQAAVMGSVERTREGHLEMIEMGVVTGAFATAATHTGAGVPANCQSLINSWSVGGTWAATPQSGVNLPAGGLYGAGTIIDVANGTLHAYNADALEGFYTAGPGLHAAPGTLDPSLKDARNDNVAGTATSHVFTSTGALVSTNWLAGSANAVSAVYMHDAIYNEFNSEAAIGGSSEWVITFPTKRFYVDPAAVLPFTSAFTAATGIACEAVDITFWNREEQTTVQQIDFSPPPPTGAGTSLCWEAQVVTFNQAATVAAGSRNFGSTYAVNIETASFSNGWARIRFDNDGSSANGSINRLVSSALLNPASITYTGLPVVGFWSANYVNSAAVAGRLANYSGSYRHRASVAFVPYAP